MTNIKPSETKNWDVVRHDPVRHSRALKELKDPEVYAYYFDVFWYPIRKPTIAEILKDEYK